MKKNTSFLDSLKAAICGLISPFRSEINLRFHFMIGNLIIIFAYYFGINAVQWAILLLSISSVICFELINTAIENAVDTATKEFSKTAKIAKDTAAGAVLFSALSAIGIGFFLFFDIEKIGNTLTYIFTTLKVLIPCVLIGIADLLFLIFGGKKNN